MYYVYILRCEGNTLYTGIAADVERRFEEHKEGKGARYTKSHPPLGVEAVWKAENMSDAAKLEYRIKQLKKDEKEDLLVNGGKALCLKLNGEDIEFERMI